jgi:hypothetical protein
MKIRPVETEFHADGRADRHDMTKLIVAFRSFANASKMDLPGVGWGGMD